MKLRLKETYFLKNKHDAYKFTCNYLKDFCKKWKGDVEIIDTDDWTNVKFILDYGSGDGPTDYYLSIKPIIFEYE